MFCPLCQKECSSTEGSGGALPPTFRCPTTVRTGGDGGRFHVEPHFVRYTTGAWATGIYYLERAILPPYKIENHHNDNVILRQVKEGQLSEIVHAPHSSIYVLGKNPKWRPRSRDINKTAFIYTLQTSLIHMDIEEKLRQRLKLILLLS
jgi:hypothetical protein